MRRLYLARESVMPPLDFTALLRRHLASGTGLPCWVKNGSGPWTYQHMANALDRASPGDSAISFNPKTWKAWNDGAPVPYESRLVVLVAVLFPDHPSTSGADKSAFQAAWAIANRNRASRTPTRPASDTEPRREWRILQRTQPLPDLLALNAHIPQAHNELGTWKLSASMVASTMYAEHAAKPVAFALRRVALRIDSVDFQPTQGSLLPQRQPAPGHKIAGNGLDILASEDTPALDGNLLPDQADDYLCIVEATHADTAETTTSRSLALTATAIARDIMVWDPDAPGIGHNSGPPLQHPNREAVLGILLNRSLPRDEADRLILGRAPLRHEAGE